MTDKNVEKALRSTILAVQLMIVWADERYHDKYNEAISVLEDAIKQDYSIDLLFFAFVRFQIVMGKPIPLYKKGGIPSIKPGNEMIINNSYETKRNKKTNK